MATIIKVDGTKEEISPKEGNKFSLQELQEAVEGYIALVSINDEPDKVLVVDEEGLLTQKESNVEASILTGKMIVGQVLVADRSQIN